MTTGAAYTPPPPAPPTSAWRPTRPRSTGRRLLRLHLASRRIPIALAALAACAAILRIALTSHWIARSGPGATQIPLAIEPAAAAIIAMTLHSPLGESERPTGRWLPYLRLGSALTLTAVAVAMLAAAAAAAHLPGGDRDILRNLAGLAGLGLLTATALGGTLAWIGPVAYTVIAQYGLTAAWKTPWIWPARPPHDLGATLCAAFAFTAGMLAITLPGARDGGRE
jgi:hypothetical protein